MTQTVRPRRTVHRRRAHATRAVFHEPRPPRLRADQPAGDGQGRAVRALLALGEVAAAAVPRRVRRRGAGRLREQAAAGRVGVERAEKLYAKVFNEYGDDSVAQLGGAHIACEYVSNVLTKVLEWGRLMAYLEQSTRYVPYTDKLHGRWRYHVPAELQGALRERYVATMDAAFELYAHVDRADAGALRAPLSRRRRGDSEAVHRAAIRAKALDTLRGMLPAATQSNVGIYGTGQAYEALLLRMRAHPLAEVRACARRDAGRAAQGDPGVPRRASISRTAAGAGASTSRTRERDAGSVAAALLDRHAPEPRDEVTLTDFDPGRRDQGRRRGALRRVAICPTISCSTHRAADDRRRARSRAARLRRRAREPPPSSRARVRAHGLPLRRAHRLRRVPRSAAPPAADARVAAALAASRLHRAGSAFAKPAPATTGRA